MSSDLFTPKDMDESMDNLLSKTYGIGGESTLVFAIHNMIFALPESGSKPVLLAGREGPVKDLCMHHGELLDCGGYNDIISTFSGKPFRKTRTNIQSIISCNDELFFSYDGFIVGGDTLYAARGKTVDDFCVREDGTLMDCGEYGVMLNTLKDNFLLKTGYRVYALEEFEGDLFFGGLQGLYKFQDSSGSSLDGIRDVWALCEHNDMLYCSYKERIIDPIFGDSIFYSNQGHMTSMVSVPTWMILSHLKQ